MASTDLPIPTVRPVFLCVQSAATSMAILKYQLISAVSALAATTNSEITVPNVVCLSVRQLLVIGPILLLKLASINAPRVISPQDKATDYACLIVRCI